MINLIGQNKMGIEKNVIYKFATGERVWLDFDKLSEGTMILNWSKPLTRKLMLKLDKEYVEKAVPYIYQQAANIMNKSILYVDKASGNMRTFEPNLN